MWRTIVVSLALLAGVARVAAAQSVEAVFQEAGLYGRWAEDCARAAGHLGGNVHSIYARADDGAALTYDSGPGRAPTVYRILRAERRGADRVFYVQQNRADGRRLEIELLRTGTAIKVWSSRRETGEVLVAGGKFPSDGVESPTQRRCGD
ncbi:MAG: hypothetical protein IPK81_13055 [Rhodospirillales bacterium]|nr:MAG: hypothetical protein IPK81_13055 [Rhodospirillales bacterium]